MDDMISRRAAIDAICKDGTQRERQGQYSMTMVDRKYRDIEILEALPSAQLAQDLPNGCTDTISRVAALSALNGLTKIFLNNLPPTIDRADAVDAIKELPPAQPGWIPCSERLPEAEYPAIVTWKNDDPASYYQYILGKHYAGVAHYKNGKWYWYSSVTEDVLMEYGRYESEEFDEAIKVLAWMPLPTPYREGGQDSDVQRDT